MSKAKREQKQFVLASKEDCIVYLRCIISKAELCLYKLKKYNKQTEELLRECENKKQEIIHYDIYLELSDTIANVIGYLLNVLGDSQTVSISYFKYRKQAEN